LGVFEHTAYTTSTYAFNPKEILVITTDGITDAVNSSNTFFGEAQLAKSLVALTNKDAKALTELLIAEVKRFSRGMEQADDITILALQYKNSNRQMSEHMQTYTLALSNKVTDLEKIVAKLEELSEIWKIPLKNIMEINLALEELFTNVVFYAYDDQDPHAIIVEFLLIDKHKIQLKLQDDGKPFNLLEKETGEVVDQSLEERAIGGLGIHFIKELIDQIEYQRVGKNNVVILTKTF
jgi:anti-sigma regulatory factor (Ser/Thr protein kinase)